MLMYQVPLGEKDPVVMKARQGYAFHHEPSLVAARAGCINCCAHRRQLQRVYLFVCSGLNQDPTAKLPSQ